MVINMKGDLGKWGLKGILNNYWKLVGFCVWFLD